MFAAISTLDAMFLNSIKTCFSAFDFGAVSTLELAAVQA
jgi:hypothetical protein